MNLDFWANIGTILAGFVATIVLLLDIYARIYTGKPDITIFVEATRRNETADFFLVIQNLGTAPAQLLWLDTSPNWSALDNAPYIHPLKLIHDHMLLPNQSLKIPIDTTKYQDLLRQHYQQSLTTYTSCIMTAHLLYQRNTRAFVHRTSKRLGIISKIVVKIKKRVFYTPKEQYFSINLSCVYMSVLPLRDVIAPKRSKRKQ